MLARDTDAGPEVLLIERPNRGSFAGAWVFPGGKVEGADATDLGAHPDEEDVARVAGVRETREETSLVVDGHELVTFACWSPPPGVPLRIRTWFLIGRAPNQVPALAPDEAVSFQWSRPDEVIAAHGRGELTLYPPTWVTLHLLGRQPDVAALLASARLGGVREFRTRTHRDEAGRMLFWGEADAAGAPTPAAHTLQTGRLPWVVTPPRE